MVNNTVMEMSTSWGLMSFLKYMASGHIALRIFSERT